MQPRSLLRVCLALLLTVVACSRTPDGSSWWQMRGLVLSTKELSEVDWPAMADRFGINTIGTHITPSEVTAFLATPEGARFQRDCRRYGICVEHQLHAMGELLPRELFAQDSTMFRMDTCGRRTPDYNCCVHSGKALDIIAGNAAALARTLRPDNHRYYLWLDDNAPVCQCPLCRAYSPSEQALIVENRMLRAIREVDPQAKVAHLAYSFFMDPPRKVQPEEGIFLEFAPIYRSWDAPLTDEDVLCPRGYPVTNGDNLRWLEQNLEVFPAEDAVVLEYWLDVSLFSRWKRPAVQLPWRSDVCRSDLATYARYGIRNVTSFAVYMDADYFHRFPSTEPVEEYGSLLRSFRHYCSFRDPWDDLSDSTQVSVCTDGKDLHVLFDVTDRTPVVCTDGDEMSVTPGDRVEVFLSCDDKMGRYYGFEMAPDGLVLDYRSAFYRQFEYDWNYPLKPVCRHTSRGYRVEASFPLDSLKTLGLLTETGPLWMGLYRADAVAPDNIYWYTLIDPRTPGPDFHVPSSLMEWNF